MSRRSDTSIRRSPQGKPNPGGPGPWPPKVRFNSSECSSTESSSAKARRPSSRLVRGLGCGPRTVNRGDGAGFGADGRVRGVLEPVGLNVGSSRSGCWRPQLRYWQALRFNRLARAPDPTLCMTRSKTTWTPPAHDRIAGDYTLVPDYRAPSARALGQLCKAPQRRMNRRCNGLRRLR